jgi:hypothetical protein
MKMSFSKPSIRQVRHAHGDSIRARRIPIRQCRLSLEHLEVRSLLSTSTLSGHLVGSQMHVVEQKDVFPKYAFNDVMAKSIDWSGSSGDDTPTESHSLPFGTATCRPLDFVIKGNG